MSARKGRRGGGHGDGHAGPDERWLLTYADMITLLLALFIVLWSMSTVNISRFAALKSSLTEAFNGKLAEGGESIQNGAPGLLSEQSALVSPNKTQPISVTNFQPISPLPDPTEQGNQQDLESLQALKAKIDAQAKKKGLEGQIITGIDERGLVIRVLTDDLIFDSGHAILRPGAGAVLGDLADLVVTESHVPNPVRVEGNTDNVPVSGGEFRSNWELSAARATSVMQYLLDYGLNPTRASVSGYADQRPIASNETPTGRSLNRRVEIVVLRRALAASEGIGVEAPEEQAKPKAGGNSHVSKEAAGTAGEGHG